MKEEKETKMARGEQGRRRRDERMKGWMMKGWGVRVQCRRVVLGDRPH